MNCKICNAEMVDSETKKYWRICPNPINTGALISWFATTLLVENSGCNLSEIRHYFQATDLGEQDGIKEIFVIGNYNINIHEEYIGIINFVDDDAKYFSLNFSEDCVPKTVEEIEVFIKNYKILE